MLTNYLPEDIIQHINNTTILLIIWMIRFVGKLLLHIFYLLNQQPGQIIVILNRIIRLIH